MTMMLRAEAEVGGRLKLIALSAADGDLHIDALDNAKSLAKWNWTISVSVEATFEIINYHFSDVYEVSTKNGVVKVSGKYVKYTPDTVGDGGFWLNGTYHAITVLKNAPLRPSITSPGSGTSVNTVYPVIASSAFAVDDATITHVSTRWQVATDEDFQNIVMDVTSTTGLTSVKTSQLDRGRTYYVRAMYNGSKP